MADVRTYSQRIAFPEELKPYYEFLQSELNRILSNNEMRQKLFSIDRSIVKNRFQNAFRAELRNLIGNETQYKWAEDNQFNYPSLWFYMIADQLKSLYSSFIDRKMLFELLQKHNFEQTEEFKTELKDLNIKWRSKQIDDYCKKRKAPEFPREKTFVMDFSSDNGGIATLNRLAKTLTFDYQYVGRKEKDIKPRQATQQLYIHPSTKYEEGAKISRPRYSKDKDGNYYGVVTFELPREYAKGENILAVDIGKIRLASARLIKPDGTYSDTFVESAYANRLKAKYEKLENELKSLNNKNKRSDTLHMSAEYISKESLIKFSKRLEHISNLEEKMRNLKVEMARVVGSDIRYFASQNEVKYLFLEDLTWLHHIGGSWNHAELQSSMENAVWDIGVETYYSNAKNTSKQNPITGTLGDAQGRDIVFKDGLRVNRDSLAPLNIGTREGTSRKIKQKGKEYKKIVPPQIKSIRDKNTETPRRIKRKTSRRREVMKIVKELVNKPNRSTEMVVALPVSSNISVSAVTIAGWGSCSRDKLVLGKVRKVHSCPHLTHN